MRRKEGRLLFLKFGHSTIQHFRSWSFNAAVAHQIHINREILAATNAEAIITSILSPEVKSPACDLTFIWVAPRNSNAIPLRYTLAQSIFIPKSVGKSFERRIFSAIDISGTGLSS